MENPCCLVDTVAKAQFPWVYIMGRGMDEEAEETRVWILAMACLLLLSTVPQVLIIISLFFIFGQGKWQRGVKGKNKQPSEQPSPHLPANGTSEEDCLFPFRQAFRGYFNPFLVANSIYQNKCGLVASSFRSLTAWRGKSLKNRLSVLLLHVPLPKGFWEHNKETFIWWSRAQEPVLY